LFLGLTVTQHGTRLHPPLNEADAKITGLFLQNIVPMSDSTCDRYVLRLSLQQGRTKPMVYKSEAELISVVGRVILAGGIKERGKHNAHR
jgi:hypothetical protein